MLQETELYGGSQKRVNIGQNGIRRRKSLPESHLRRMVSGRMRLWQNSCPDSAPIGRKIASTGSAVKWR